MNLQVKFKKVSSTAKTPTKAHPTDACFDLYADIPDKGIINIKPHETVKIPVGVALAIPRGYFGAIFARSGLATKQDLAPANKVGCVDSPYRGEVIVALHNHGEHIQEVAHGDKIAQLGFIPVPSVDLVEVDELDETDRGAGGFGSTGK